VLHSTSRGWAHINTVNILVPSSWTNVSAEATQSVHEDAQIRVENSSPVYGDSPFTVQTGECGEEGEYIQVTQNFLTQQVAQSDSVFGPAGRVFVYEWSRFRYGVFEEHGYPGDPLYPMFYLKQVGTEERPLVEVRPNFCTNTEPEGRTLEISGGHCTNNPSTGLPDDDCIFVASGPENLRSSVMAVPYLAGNDQWCDQTEARDHDDEIPTKQNAMCDGQSVMEVVMKHPDFSGFQPRINLTGEVDTTPTFKLIRPSATAAFSFVLDVSGSMDGDKISRMKQGVRSVMTSNIDYQKNTGIGVVSFSSSADIDHEVVPISTDGARDEIIDTVDNLRAGGSTSLGSGLSKGLEALENYGLQKGGALVFLTDGMQSSGYLGIQDVIDEVVSREVRVCTVAFGKDADPDIEELAERTNGAAYFVSDNSGPAEINNALSSCLEFLPSPESEDKETVILQETFSNTPSASSSVTIDQFTGKDVTVQLDFQLYGEAEVFMDFANFSTETISGTGVVTFPFERVEPGDYTVNVTTDGAAIQFLTLQIRSKAPPQTVPLTTSCWTNVGQMEVNLQGSSPDRLVLYGKVFQGVSPVIKADIKGVVSSEENTKVEVRLKDDGIAPDNIKNDGIYSAYFTDFKPNQRQSRHSFSIKVRGTEDTSLVAGTAPGRSFPSVPTPSTPLCCGSTAVKEDTPLEPTGIFSRSASGGVITFGQTGADTNIFPPGPIRDLSVGDFTQDHFLLSFTSPGADLDTGTIDQFIIFYSQNKTLLTNLTVSSDIPRVSASDLACSNCTLDPLPPSDKVQLSLNLNSFTRGEKVFFRVLAADQEGKTSQSNMANILLSDPPKSSASRNSLSLLLLALVSGHLGFI